MLRTLSPPDSSFLVSSKMPVDLSPYLLSASPPSSFDFLSAAFAGRYGQWGLPTDKCEHKNSVSVNSNEDLLSDGISGLNLHENFSQSERLKPIIGRSNSINSDVEEDENDCSTASYKCPSPNRSLSPKLRKKVSFADHKGLALATVKIMSEPSHMPPTLSPSVLTALTQGATAGVTDQQPLVLKFPQPASDYLAFRDRIEKNFLSLENVIIRNYNVIGTLKVKNICFEKKVFLRCTFDSWDSHMDINAMFVNNGPKNMYDTFSFEFEVPTNFNKDLRIEFAICFQEGNGTEHWDSNEDKNYQIVSAVLTPLDPVPTPTDNNSSQNSDILRNVDSWTKFSAWTKVDTSVPYW